MHGDVLALRRGEVREALAVRPVREEVVRAQVLRVDTGEHMRTLRHELLVHPAGMLEHDGRLYVLEQSHRAMLVFNVSTGKLEAAPVRGLPDLPEGIAISLTC